MRPANALPKSPPARLKDHPAAAAAWRQLMRTYGELQAEIVTRLDLDLLVDYCLLMEQIAELDQMRDAAFTVWREMTELWKQLPKEIPFDEKLDIAMKIQGAEAELLKVDARADQKRKTLHQWRQSLYLTPRSRAGVAPPKKAEEQPLDPMDALLGEVTDFVNGQGNEE